MRRLPAAALTACVVALASQPSSARLCSPHEFIGDSPAHSNPGWHDEAQGLAHDRDCWFVTQNNADSPPTDARLWRIPVTTDLAANVACGHDGVSCSSVTDFGLYPAYNHYGDPDYFEFNGRGYVLVPVEGTDPATDDGVLIFRADETLALLAFRSLPGQVDSPWVAVDGDGVLYSSHFQTEGLIRRYQIDWAAFQALGEQFPPPLLPLEPMYLQDEAGFHLNLPNAQGGEFSDDMQRFYLVNGNGRGDALPSEGIHVFRIVPTTGPPCREVPGTCLVALRIEQSHNSSDPGFAFEFHPGLNAGASFQEPEGLTFWDLDADGRAPGMRGKLHVVLLDNDLDGDEVYVKHYTFADDTEPLAVVCPSPVTVECESPSGVAASSPQLSAFLAGASATDACSTATQITSNAPAVFPRGTTPVTFTATDGSGNQASCQAPVTVVDTTAPTISVTLSRDTLWPPNHKLVPITAQVTVADGCGTPSFELVSITSSDPDDGSGDGGTDGDVQGAELGTPDTSFLLRAERAGSSKSGRAYTIVYRVTDASGNASVADAVVRVPHSK